MFASKTPRDLNHDPLPWHCPGADEKYRIPQGEQQQCDEYTPRPEFDHVQHNEPNPILVALRERPGDVGVNAARVLFMIDALLGGATPDPAEDHARRVLTRLAALAEVS